MPDILLFGATGYTGRLTADALARRGADFAIAGRSEDRLRGVSARTNQPEIRIAAAGDVESLAHALRGVKVLVTCVGPFVELGDTAVEAALQAGVNYIDSTGEGIFIDRLIERWDERAREAGVVLAPAMGFDEVPADVAATLATDGMDSPDLTLTYALPMSGSSGTVRSALGIVVSEGPWIEAGERRAIRASEEERWAPMPPPLGPRRSISFPFAEGRLAPLHLPLNSFRSYVTTGTVQKTAMKLFMPAMRAGLGTPGGRWIADRIQSALPAGPSDRERERARWTVLAEASDGPAWRNVALMGTDAYGLTAEFLTTAALEMSRNDFSGAGVCAPVQAVGLETLHKELVNRGVSIQTYEATA